MLTNHAALQTSAFSAKPIFKSIQHNDYVCENEHMFYFISQENFFRHI